MSKQTYSLFLSQSVCRCCGMEKTSGFNLLDTTNDRVSKLIRHLCLLPKKVISLKPADKLTKFICVDCEMTLQHFNEFCEMIKKVQHNLKSTLKLVSNEENVKAKLQNKADCHLNGVSEDGGPVVISVGSDGKITCEDCQSDLVTSDLITLHMLTHGLGTVICMCRHCSHRDDIGSFLQHDTNSVKCSQCLFANYEEQSCEVDQNKPSNGRYSCETCDKRFHTKYRYNRHKLIHTGIKPFLCETCGMKFNQKISLKTHVMKHAKVSPYSCHWCGQSFRFKASLQSHTINIHGNSSSTTSKYECNQCHKQFATSYKLQRHYRLHTGDRPYECPICHKHFSQTGNLQNHVKKHNSENTFPNTFSADQIIDNDQILDNILDSCPQEKDFMGLERQERDNYELVNRGSVDKHNATDLFSDFSPQDVLFDNNSILPSQTPNVPIILPNFSSLQGTTTDINL